VEFISHSQIESLGGLQCPELVEIINDFLADLDGNLGELCQLARDKNYEQLRESAHRLKGGASMSGFPALATAAANFEKTAQDENAQVSESELSRQLVPAIEEARSAFKLLLKAVS
jgi:HPt (histidine-containing phosphotransfer) domain-containing protein